MIMDSRFSVKIKIEKARVIMKGRFSNDKC